MVRMQEAKVNEVATWAKADEMIHDEFTDKLIEEGIDEDELIQVSLDVGQLKEDLPFAEYYDNLVRPTVIERDVLDFSKPFGLFDASINIRLSERLNILERETVQIYKRKLCQFQERIDEVKKEEE